MKVLPILNGGCEKAQKAQGITIIFVYFVFFAAIIPFSVTPASVAAQIASSAGTAVELIADAGFERGFRIKDPDAQGRVVTWNPAAKPAWDLVHHHSKSSFADAGKFAMRANGFTFNDDYGRLDVHPAGGDADVILGVNASKEFGGVYRKQGEPWPHLYLSQRISSPGGHLAAGSPSIAELARVDFSVDVRLLHDRANKTASHKRSIHAAQFVFFFTIQNLNRKSPGYGDYYWFGVLLYDDRKPVTSLFAMHDKGSPLKKGTDKLIYDIGVAPFTKEVVAQGGWVSVRGDLLPHILAGLQEGWKRGYLPASHELADYRFGSVVTGFEITGLNDVAVAVKGLRAAATLKAAK